MIGIRGSSQMGIESSNLKPVENLLRTTAINPMPVGDSNTPVRTVEQGSQPWPGIHEIFQEE